VGRGYALMAATLSGNTLMPQDDKECEVIWCAQDKGNCKAAAIFGVDESNVRLWQKQKAAISGSEASQKKFTGPKKG